MSMAAGIPIGIGVGFAAGLASGKKQARDVIERNLHDLTERHTITIQNQAGQLVSIDEFLNEALSGYDEKHRKSYIAMMIIGVLLFLVGVTVFFMLRSRTGL